MLWIWRVAFAAVLLIPLFFCPTGKNAFRLPKELLLRADVIVLLFLIVSAAILGTLRGIRLKARDPVLILAASLTVWTLITVAASTNRRLSAMTALLFVEYLLFFLAIYLTSSWQKISVARWALAPAVLNAMLVMLQAAKIWNPFPRAAQSPDDAHTWSIALLGNPNDVGAYLITPYIAALALSHSTTRRRWFFIAVAAVLFGGIIASQTITALAAALVGTLMYLIVVLPKKSIIVAGGCLAILTVGVLAFYSPVHRRFEQTVDWLRSGQYDTILSGRLAPFEAAVLMFRDHPLMGTGPGTFGWQYFDYKLKAERRDPALLDSVMRPHNWGEVHNDYLEVAAEGGAPALLLFLAALVLVARTRRSNTSDARGRFATLFALPFVASFAVLAMAQFPLQIVAPTVTILFYAALCLGWTADDTA